MERRDFIKLCSVAGLGLASSQLPGTYLDANAAVDGKTGWFFFNATGGWDIFRVTCPKGNQNNSEGFAVNSDFAQGDILSVGDIEYAPVGNNQALFSQYGNLMTVINGIDCETNGHDTGQQVMMSGRLQQNSPALPALIAAAHGGAKPLSFITNGGYDSTFGVPVSKTRLGDTGALMPLIYTNAQNPNDEQQNFDLFHTEETFNRIMATRQARLDEMQQRQNLPLIKNKMNLLYTARQGMGELKKINDFLPDQLSQSNIERQAEIALAAFAAGLCQTATITGGGFDTHGNNDQGQDNSRSNLFQGIIRWLQRVDELNLADRVIAVVGSDFGRTPRYNEAQGKDHWSVGCMIVIDPSEKLPGGRVFGGTNEVGQYEKVDASGQVGGNITIKNATVHKWMRSYAGIEDNDVVKLFPLNTGANELDFG